MPYVAQTKFKSGGKGFVYNLKQAFRDGESLWEDSSPQMENDIVIRIENNSNTLSKEEMVSLEEALIMLLNMRYGKSLLDDVNIIKTSTPSNEPSHIQYCGLLGILKQLV